MDFFEENWRLLCVGAILGLMAWQLVRYQIRRYCERVKGELAEYSDGETSTPGVAPVPIQQPPRNVNDTATVAEFKQAIWKSMTDFPITNPYDQIGILVTRLALSQVDYRFKEIYSLMTASQQRLLKSLNDVGGKMSRADVEKFFMAAREADERMKPATFLSWFTLLDEGQFINSGFDSFTLTQGGQDFLVWITRSHLPDRTHEGV